MTSTARGPRAHGRQQGTPMTDPSEVPDYPSLLRLDGTGW